MSEGKSVYVPFFAVETNFQRLACRPGGIPRDQALRNAKIQVLRLFTRTREPIGDGRDMPVSAIPLRHGYLAMAWASSLTE
jgi:hypothetical protein